KELGLGIAQHDQKRLDRPQPGKGIERLQRIIEEVFAVIDTGQARPQQEVFPQDLVPEVVNEGNLREKPVSADIEAISLVIHRARQPTDLVTGFKEGDPLTESGKLVGGG